MSVPLTGGRGARLLLALVVLSGLLVSGAEPAAGQAVDGPGGRSTLPRGDLVESARFAGANRFETASRIAQEFSDELVRPAADAVVLARADLFPDALAGSYLSGLVDAPLLLTGTGSLDETTRARITALGARTAYLLGSEAAISGAVVTALEGLGLDVVRIGGAERNATAAAIATSSPGATVGLVDGAPTAILARNEAFPDALVAGNLAAARQLPLLLTAPDALPDVTAAALDQLGIQQVVIAGGNVAVAQAVEDRLVADGITVRRIFGAERTATAAAFAEFSVDELAFRTDEVALARSDDFPDALALSAFAGREEISTLLAAGPDSLGQPATDYLASLASCSFTRLYVAGGAAAVTPAVEQAAREALTFDGDCGALLAGLFTPTQSPIVDAVGRTNGDDPDTVTVTYSVPVSCTDAAPEQFTYRDDDGGGAVRATAIACDGTATVVLTFPDGTLESGDGVLEYVQSFEPADRILDADGNPALSPDSEPVTVIGDAAPTPTPSGPGEPSPSASPTDQPSPTASPTDEPSPTASPTDGPSPTPSPTDEPSPTPSPTPDPEPVAESITVTPETQTAPVGESATVTITVTGDDGEPFAGAQARVEIEGQSPRTVTTDSDGQAEVTFTSDEATTIDVTACTNQDGSLPADCEDADLRDTASVTFEQRRATTLVLTAESDTANVGETLTVTATLTDQAGDPFDGEVTFTAEPAPGSSATPSPGGATVQTGTDGTADFSFTSGTPGEVDVTATSGEASDTETVEFVVPTEQVRYLAVVGAEPMLVEATTTDPDAATGRRVPITGLNEGTQVAGLDVRPASGVLYLLGTDGQLYTLDDTDGTTLRVGAPIPDFSPSSGIGFDFNPAADRLRIVTGTQNYRVDPDTGAVLGEGTAGSGEPGTLQYSDGTDGTGADITAAAYTNSFRGAPPAGTVLYDLDTGRDALVIQSPANDGDLQDVGPLGVDADGANGFDISPDFGQAFYAVLDDGSGSDLYVIDPASGTAVDVGEVGVAAIDYPGFTVGGNLVPPETSTPTVETITPSSGPEAGGTAVTIRGSGFDTGATVTFGGEPATSVTFVSAETLTAVTPEGFGTVDVTVTNPDGGSATLPGGFTYLQEVFVDDTADPAGADGSLARPFTTIQEGLDAVRDGGTVFVFGGTYDERPVADGGTSFTLVGSFGDQGRSVVAPTDAAPAGITTLLTIGETGGPGQGQVVDVSGLDLDGVDVGSAEVSGLDFVDAGGSFRDGSIRNLDAVEGGDGFGIRVVGDSQAPSEVAIERVTLESFDARAIEAQGAATVDVLDSNIVGEGFGRQSANVQDGIVYLDETAGEVDGTTISGIGPSGAPGSLVAPDGSVGFALLIVDNTAARSRFDIAGNTFDTTQGIFRDTGTDGAGAGAIRSRPIVANNAIEDGYVSAGDVDSSSELYGNLSEEGSDPPSMVQYALDRQGEPPAGGLVELGRGASYAGALTTLDDDGVGLTADPIPLGVPAPELTGGVILDAQQTLVQGLVLTEFADGSDPAPAAVRILSGANHGVTGNTITGPGSEPDSGAPAAIGVALSPGGGTAGAIVSGNTISAVVSGVVADAGGSGEVSGNSVADVQTGVAAATDAGLEILDNSFGAIVDGGEAVDVAGSTVTVNGNRFTDVDDYGVRTSSDDDVDATENWWGAAGGPTAESNTANAVPGTGALAGPSGAGTGEVRYEPWCVVEDCSDLSPFPEAAAPSAGPGTFNAVVDWSKAVALAGPVTGYSLHPTAECSDPTPVLARTRAPAGFSEEVTVSFDFLEFFGAGNPSFLRIETGTERDALGVTGLTDCIPVQIAGAQPPAVM